jgi:lactoylglutathione lyase
MMRTLHPAYRVSDLARSVEFYAGVGFREIGRVTLGDGSVLVMVNLPGDGDVVTLELVDDRSVESLEIGNGFSHLAVQVDDLAATLVDLDQKGIAHDAVELPGGEGGPAVCNLRDPDGYRIELVQWPPGHPDGITSADFR